MLTYNLKKKSIVRFLFFVFLNERFFPTILYTIYAKNLRRDAFRGPKMKVDLRGMSQI